MKQTFLFFLVLIGTAYLWAEDNGQWVYCSGEAAVHNITMEEARVLALRQARMDAVEKGCGVSLHAETLVRNFITAGDFIHSMSSGKVVEERGMRWKTITVPSERPGVLPLVVLRVDMEARVAADSGKSDPSFRVNLNLNRTAFQSGDEVVFRVTTSKDCHLIILNLGADDTVRVLFPNKWQKDGFIPAGAEKEIPDEADRRAGVHFRVATVQPHTSDSEIVFAVATKREMDILYETDPGTGFGLLGTPKMAVTRLARWLSEIPISERAEATVLYTVHANEK
ncbi:MAG TPA: DUF4384 domain-containing protein [bacterium]